MMHAAQRRRGDEDEAGCDEQRKTPLRKIGGGRRIGEPARGAEQDRDLHELDRIQQRNVGDR